jgi:DNA-binding winged helix-turn-helix (wHTH) protein
MRAYQLGRVGFDPDACELCSDGLPQHLQPQVRNVLLCLINHAGDVVRKDALIAEAWPDRAATEECLTRCISLLRKHFKQHGEPHLIETIPRVGYRLISNPVLIDKTTVELPAVKIQESAFMLFDATVLKAVTALGAFGLLLIFMIISTD